MALRLMTVPGDLDAVRALLLPQESPTDAATILPDATISLPSVGGRAEAIVIERLGIDWLLFVAPVGTIPTNYAQGDAVLAVQLVHDALVQFTCLQLVESGLFAQLVPLSQRTPDAVSYNLSPQALIGVCATFKSGGYAALNLLKRAVPVAGRTFVSPSAGASGQLAQTIRTQHVHQRGWCGRRDPWDRW